LVAGQDFRDVHDANRFLLSANDPIQMHKAGHIDRREDFCPGALVVTQAIVAHHARDGFFRHGEHSAKTTTLVLTFQL
jgi:hypothetical protein